MPFDTKLLDKAKEMMEENSKEEVDKNVVLETPEETTLDKELDQDTDNSLKQSEIFDIKSDEESEPERPISKKTGKPKRVLTEKQKECLAKAREKGLAKRRQLALVKKKDKEVRKAERTKHIREKRAKQEEEEAQIAALAHDQVQATEKAMWDEDKLTALMTRTMDTYFEKRRVEKTKRSHIPLDPAMQGGYYLPGQPPQNYIQHPPPQAAPQPQIGRSDPLHPEHNPYFKLFGLK